MVGRDWFTDRVVIGVLCASSVSRGMESSLYLFLYYETPCKREGRGVEGLT